MCEELSVNAFDLVLLDEWVLLCEFLLVLGEVVEAAVVELGLAMLAAEDVATLASDLDNANFLCTVPALIRISLLKYQVARLVISWLNNF